MRPRSRLLSKRRLLLPTIREGAEEPMRDLNEGSSLHIAGHGPAVSSEDYLLSICHLAHPTFQTRDVSTVNNRARQLDAVHQRLRLPRLSGTPSRTFKFTPTGGFLGDGKDIHGKLTFGNSDPLECLYGHQDNLTGGVKKSLVQGRFMEPHGSQWEGQARPEAHSIPNESSPNLPRRRKSSFTELYTSTSTNTNISSQHSITTLEARRGGSADGGAEEGRRNATAKQSFISQWISDCKSTWREARVRACMLPAIAEI
ncbi:uncharacterized protein si:dkeyp-72g9.4 [Brachionichthys hirsutus]|uniref:uncharacterized protein si:dkeyp-72g9.4 n=1 Tax=Brachionichthys hirsutus TaxID=412623 RepID=UPI0036043DF8